MLVLGKQETEVSMRRQGTQAQTRAQIRIVEQQLQEEGGTKNECI